jgi:hypothetical protein
MAAHFAKEKELMMTPSNTALVRHPVGWKGRRVEEVPLKSVQNVYLKPALSYFQLHEAIPRPWQPHELRSIWRLHNKLAPWVTLILVPQCDHLGNRHWYGSWHNHSQLDPFHQFDDLGVQKMGGLYIREQALVLVTLNNNVLYKTLSTTCHEFFHACDNYLTLNERNHINQWSMRHEHSSQWVNSPYRSEYYERRARAFQVWAAPFLERMQRGDNPIPWVGFQADPAERLFNEIWRGQIARRRPRFHWKWHRRFMRLKDVFLPCAPAEGDWFP